MVSKVERSMKGLSDPKIQVTFYGDEHSPFNLQGANDALAIFRSSLGRFDRSIFFTEGAGQTPANLRNFREQILKYKSFSEPLLRSIMSRQLSREPFDSEVGRRRDQINTNGLAESLGQGLLSVHNARDYLMLSLLDEIKGEYKLELDAEVHTGEAYTSLQRIRSSADALYSLSIENFGKGDFQEMLKATLRYYQTMSSAIFLREKDIVEQLRGHVRQGLKGSQRVFLFIFFGGLHEPMVHKLANRNDFKTNGGLDVYNTMHDGPTWVICNSLREKMTVPELLLAQDRFQHFLIQTIIERLMNRRAYRKLSDNFKQIFSETVDVAREFTLSDLQSICESGVNPLDVIDGHPKTILLESLLKQ